MSVKVDRRRIDCYKPQNRVKVVLNSLEGRKQWNNVSHCLAQDQTVVLRKISAQIHLDRNSVVLRINCAHIYL